MLNIVVDVLPYFCYHFEADVSVKLMHIFVLFLQRHYDAFFSPPGLPTMTVLLKLHGSHCQISESFFK